MYLFNNKILKLCYSVKQSDTMNKLKSSGVSWK